MTGLGVAWPRCHPLSQSKVNPRQTQATHPHPSPLPIPSPHPHHSRGDFSSAILGGSEGFSPGPGRPGGPAKATPLRLSSGQTLSPLPTFGHHQPTPGETPARENHAINSRYEEYSFANLYHPIFLSINRPSFWSNTHTHTHSHQTS